MHRSLSSIRASLARAVRQVYSRAGRAFPPKRWHHLSEVRRFSHQVQGTPDPSVIGRALVSAIAQGVAAERVLLFLLHPNQDKLVVAASEGVDDLYPMSLQRSSPFLIWLGEQHRVVAAEEIHPLPQWQVLPPAEREALSAFGSRLFVSMPTGSANNALLVIGSRKGGTT